MLRLFGLESGSVLVELLAFTPYVAATAVVPLIVAAILREWPAASLAALALVALAIMVLPRAFGEPTEASGGPGPVLRVLAANMRVGEGSAQRLIDLVRELEVDVLSVEELTPQLARRLEGGGVGELLVHQRLQPAPGSFGSGLYSRLPLGSPSIRELPGGFPLISARIALPGAASVEVVSVHTNPPTIAGWEEDLDALPDAVPPRIMLGDFNATLDHAAFRDLLDSGYNDAAETLGSGLTPTWSTGGVTVPPLFAIDHVIAGDAIGIRGFSAPGLPDSDHRAVFAELELPAG